MSDDLVMDEPRERSFRWQVKDASRGYWHVEADFHACFASDTEEGFYKSVWKVTVRQDHPRWLIEMTVETQYDQPIGLDDVACALRSEFFLFFDEAMRKDVRLSYEHDLARLAAYDDAAAPRTEEREG